MVFQMELGFYVTLARPPRFFACVSTQTGAFGSSFPGCKTNLRVAVPGWAPPSRATYATRRDGATSSRSRRCDGLPHRASRLLAEYGRVCGDCSGRMNSPPALSRRSIHFTLRPPGRAAVGLRPTHLARVALPKCTNIFSIAAMISQ